MGARLFLFAWLDVAQFGYRSYLDEMEKVVLSSRPYIRDFTKLELEKLIESNQFPRYRADQILDWVYQKNVRSFDAIKNLPKELIAFLKEKADLNRLELVSKHESFNHESIKFLTRTQDGLLCESVLIVQRGRPRSQVDFGDKLVLGAARAKGRNTVCVSTQLGCRIRCIFCASGKGKFGRNLTAGEIVEQISLIASEIKERVTNIVFMGMGEPLDNYENVIKALSILRAKWGYGLSGRRITVSTSGIPPKLRQFLKDTEGKVRLSVSLHSSNEETRSFLVPINKKYHLDELIKELDFIHQKLKREITFEYTLIGGINDTREEAEGTARLASRLGAKVNLIPYNPIQEMNLETPSKTKIEEFRKLLELKGVVVTVRQTAGRDINAACGQLRLDRTTGATEDVATSTS
ncbi:MAG: 23S rRNA (adenine(2503)-C(2))-methyltransferase RlmN [Candidatus Omnitrophica bacterium]|nr:23S rRNA (adenine(2503)-C(2))-methyltransferase RlmN [Candidatus Omnitrophota bacterium]